MPLKLNWPYSDQEPIVCNLNDLLAERRTTGIQINVIASQFVTQGRCLSLDGGRTWAINKSDLERLKSDAA